MVKFVFDWDPKYKLGIVYSEQLDLLRESMSVEDKGATLGKYRRSGNWQSIRRYAITKNGRFSIGIFPEVYSQINLLGIPNECIITDNFKKKFKCGWINDENYNPLELDIVPRQYQIDCIKKCLQFGHGIVMIGTAGGKTLTMGMLIHNINNITRGKTLLITIPSLVNQTYEDFIEYGLGKYYTISKWDSSNQYTDTDIVIASNTILMSKKQDIDILNNYDLVINDECHKTRAGNRINDIFKKIKTPHKFGFTGSLPDSKIDIWNIIGKFGPIIYERKSVDLQREGHIASAQAVILKINYKNRPIFKSKPSITNPTGLYIEECDFIYKNEFRNKLIGKLCNNIDKNTLILVDRLEHQDQILDTLKTYAPDKNIQYVRGEVEMSDRQKIRELMEVNDNIICVAMSSIFATGINIKNIHYIIFALTGKAKIRILQSIGRGLRKHDSKKLLTIFDLADNLYYGLKHLEHRLELYEEENINYGIKHIEERWS